MRMPETQCASSHDRLLDKLCQAERVKLNGMHHVTLTVTDIERTCEWYRSVLGFQDVARYRNDSIMAECHALAHPDSPSPTIGLRQYDNSEDRAFDEHRIGLDHLAFDVGDRESLQQWQEHLGRLGIECTVTHLPELSILVMRDPDNIQIELCTRNVEATSSSVGPDGRIHLPGSNG
jgi:glyoxylase I family protein